MVYGVASPPPPFVPRILQRRALNDTLRRYGMGGRSLISSGVAALPSDDLATVLWAVSKFDAFDANLDREGDHAVGYVDIRGYNVLFQIVGGGTGLIDHPTEQERVLTVMLADEY